MQIFMLQVKMQFPQFFNDVFVLDCGSLDVNGNNRYLFQDLHDERPDGKSCYYGIDRVAGNNVSEVCLIHEFDPVFSIPVWNVDDTIDIILCVEVLEHDEHWMKSIAHMIDILRPGGMLIITAAGPKRDPHSAYLVGQAPGDDEHYLNMSEDILRGVMSPDTTFEQYEFAYGRQMRDQYFWGVKR